MAVVPNQLDTIVAPQLGRPLTDYEIQTFSKASPQTLANIKNTYSKLNTNNSIVDYLTFNGQDPSLANRTALAQKYGITNIGTAEGNTALLNALKSGSTPTPTPVSGSIAQTVATPTQTSEQPITPAPVGTDTALGGSVAGAAGSTPAPSVDTDPNVQSAKQAVSDSTSVYQQAQSTVASIDDQIRNLRTTMSQALKDKEDQAAASGGVIDRAQIAQQVAFENSGIQQQINDLMSQRSVYATEQRNAQVDMQTATKAYQDAQNNFYKTANLNIATQKLTDAEAQTTTKNAQTTAKDLIASVKSGNTDLTQLSQDQISQLEVSGGFPTGYLTHLSQFQQTPGNQAALAGMIAIYRAGTMPAFGMSASSPLREMFFAAIGADPSIVSDYVANKGNISALTKALGTQQNQLAANKTSIGILDKQLTLVQKYSDKVSRSDSPLVNKYILWTKGQVAGDADTAALNNIILTASTEFAKILSGASASIAGVTVSSSEDAKDLLNSAMSQGQLIEVLGLMRTEAGYRLSSQQESIDTINSTLGSVGSGNTAQSVNNVSGIKSNGTFTKYGDSKTSFQATVSDITNKQKGDTSTGLTPQSNLQDFVDTWTGEGSAAGYSGQDLANALGVPITTPFSTIDPTKLAGAVAKLETGYDYTTDSFTGGGSNGGMAKGNMKDSDFVESTLKSSGKTYTDVLAMIPAGQRGVINNVTGEIGSIDPSEFDPAKYTSL